jgi:hypothetical protein
MSLFTRMAGGAGFGGVLGTAIGTLVGGAAATAVVAITAPVSIPAMFATGAYISQIEKTSAYWKKKADCGYICSEDAGLD